MSNEKATELSLKDVLSPEYTANPYRLYKQLRDKDPIYWDQQTGSWIVTRWADAVTAFRDPGLSAQRFFLDVNWFPEAVQYTLKLPISALMRQFCFLTHLITHDYVL